METNATNATFTTRNNFSGADYEYANGPCIARGEFRYVESKLNSVQINGNYTKEDGQYGFFASRDTMGNMNLSGVPSEIIVEVATEVKAIVAEIEALNATEE